MDKIEEIKKLLWILDSKHNVSVPQTKENIDYIADEIVKLFAIHDVVGKNEQLVCEYCNKDAKPTCCDSCLESMVNAVQKAN